MGCNSSTPNSEPGQKKMTGKNEKPCIPTKITIDYFNIGEGRADPIRLMFEYHGQSYEKNGMEMPAWEAQKARGDGGEFGGGLPQCRMVMDGKNVRLA